MTFLEFLVLILIVIAIIFLIYYFFKGSGGHISPSRPMESRVDEYLDRRFEQLVTEWELVRVPEAERFTRENEPVLKRSENRVAELHMFEQEITSTLDNLEVRLATLEKDVDGKTKERPGTGT
ncbi:MAG: hypothetical protein PHF64_07875 [Methanoregula sp.]|nr:hypothetical protein [Methanoregula sp.]MDD5025390.1 hypothetical protein [Methanoregula sp.]